MKLLPTHLLTRSVRNEKHSSLKRSRKRGQFLEPFLDQFLGQFLEQLCEQFWDNFEDNIVKTFVYKICGKKRKNCINGQFIDVSKDLISR